MKFKALVGNYVELFYRLPPAVIRGVEDGVMRCSLTALNKWAQMPKRQRCKVTAELFQKRCTTLDVALELAKERSFTDQLRERQRLASHRGSPTRFMLNHTPLAYSGDLESFFIPPDYPERMIVEDRPISVESIKLKEKPWARRL